MKYSYIFINATVALFLTLGLISCQGKRSADSSASGLKKIHFEFNSSSIEPEMAQILDNNAGYLKKHKDTEVVVEGHCDERGTNEYNLALGDRRAYSTKEYLLRKGVSSTHLRTVSYGEEKPLDNGHDEASWYMNRRAEFERQ
ncbi:MAG: peptidoglycan-associated lipoprotein [Deltaproteobacteria bacterium RIFCSPLOWO2_12_FULL_40_28]|nr:MAG: peptidoglycan-associated lipoprotein [Deltaproteobacteria bacterium RIFCSPHIGHO2_02_FULL_40_28]OGQ21120.1 MAG: peptidoglycan-associated lipoprotein [Deltaproteobacteria bacterium RIFCSPHIGHO2_12_FULL_40_32]OGQ39037.1 MAG: peptidoglycan-associated lipoprotein [Deltaproteobacteria bacterium RIFCSPLOWO2_02_FULL_40_36]OGQ53085.1 MAG: peptidoglycan-associated lipoprotein [Deltaproteobacteria bacterium RIFCSPLOWO2_12_FULL_40_28]